MYTMIYEPLMISQKETSRRPQLGIVGISYYILLLVHYERNIGVSYCDIINGSYVMYKSIMYILGTVHNLC